MSINTSLSGKYLKHLLHLYLVRIPLFIDFHYIAL